MAAKTTTIQISTGTRDRLKAHGDTYEDALVLALDALEDAQFWREADEAKQRFDALPEGERQEILDYQAEITAAFSGL